VKLVAVGVAELYSGEWCATTRVVNDLLYNSSDVSMALSEVEGSELCRCFVEAGVGCEDRATTLPEGLLAMHSWWTRRLLSRKELLILEISDLWLRMTLPILI